MSTILQLQSPRRAEEKTHDFYTRLFYNCANMRSLNTQNGANIKDLLKNQPRRTVVTSQRLLDIGISREQQRSLVRSGWLKRLGTGAYSILEDTVELPGALYALQHDLALSVHEGGYTALWTHHGLAHNLIADRKTQLFCIRGERLPAWFTARYGSDCSIHSLSLFQQSVGIVDLDAGGLPLKVSSPERAMMEMLYLSPDLHTLPECYQLMELLVSVRPKQVQALLENCSSIKIKRLFLHMADLAGHSWLKRLDLSRVDLGKGVREITKGGHLDRKYQLVIGEIRSI